MRRMLLEALPPGTVKWNKKLLSITEREYKSELMFEDGTSVVTDVVIGADGIKSLVKKCQRGFMNNKDPSVIEKKRKRDISASNIESIPREISLQQKSNHSVFYSRFVLSGCGRYLRHLYCGPSVTS